MFPDANHSILFLFTFNIASQLFGKQGCKSIYPVHQSTPIISYIISNDTKFNIHLVFSYHVFTHLDTHTHTHISHYHPTCKQNSAFWEPRLKLEMLGYQWRVGFQLALFLLFLPSLLLFILCTDRGRDQVSGQTLIYSSNALLRSYINCRRNAKYV